MSSQIVAYAQAVESVFRERLPQGPDGVTVSSHLGEFGQEEIDHYRKKTPAVIVAPLGMPKTVRGGGNAMTDVHWAAFVLTRSKPEVDRGELAMALVEGILAFLPFESFGCARVAMDIESANLYSGKVDSYSMALWAVRWKSTIELPASGDCTYDSLADFLRLNAEYHMDVPGEHDPTIFEAPQQIELEGPE
jgi:hypothetical protein